MIPNRECSKCPRGQGIMEGEMQEIPKRVPLPVPLNPTINLNHTFLVYYTSTNIMLYMSVEAVVLLNSFYNGYKLKS